MRRRLDKGVRMYTGDDFNYAELIAGDEQGYSDALLGIFDAIAPAAAAALARLAAATAPRSTTSWRRRCRCRATSSRRRRASTRPASCSWPISTAIRTISPWSAARRARARRCIWPSCSAWPTRPACSRSGARRGAHATVLATRGVEHRDARLFAGPRLLSLNTATGAQAGRSREIIEACARHGIRGDRAVARPGAGRRPRARGARIRDAGLKTVRATAAAACFRGRRAARIAARDDNRRAVDEAAALGAPCLVLVVGGLPQFARPERASKDIGARAHGCRDGIAELLDYARQASMPLAIEPLHPMYAADRACVNTLEQALDICDGLDPDAPARSASRSTSITSGGIPSLRQQIARRPRQAPARLPRLRLAGADHGHAQRPRHDGRRRYLNRDRDAGIFGMLSRRLWPPVPRRWPANRSRGVAGPHRHAPVRSAVWSANDPDPQGL